MSIARNELKSELAAKDRNTRMQELGYNIEDVSDNVTDIRWSSNNPFYASLGFKLSHITPPNYWYIMLPEIKRTHRYGLRKTKMIIRC